MQLHTSDDARARTLNEALIEAEYLEDDEYYDDEYGEDLQKEYLEAD